MSPHVPLGKLSEQPPPFDFNGPTTLKIAEGEPNPTVGYLAYPLANEQMTRARALHVAVTALPEHTATEEYVIAAHWIATGQILEGSNNE